jgi:hypothetical protein
VGQQTGLRIDAEGHPPVGHVRGRREHHTQRQGHGERGEQAERSAQGEPADRDPSRPGVLGDEQSADEIAAEDEEPTIDGRGVPSVLGGLRVDVQVFCVHWYAYRSAMTSYGLHHSELP